MTVKNLLSLFNLENFLNVIPGCIYWKDINGIYLGCNHALVKKNHLESPEQIIGKTDFEIWPDRAEAIRKSDLEVMQLNKIIEIEEVVILNNGERLYFSSVKSPLKNQNNNIIGVIGNSLDITELKEAQRNAQNANHAKTQFLALMGHELRMPLTGIISTANLLAEGEITLEESCELGKIIEHSGSYLLSTIDAILDFAKIKAKKFELISAPINLKTIIEEVSAIFEASAKEKKLQLLIHYDPTTPHLIITDSRIIRHIMTNLISNAIKYTETGTITVSVKNVKQTKTRVQLKISVEDTGIGVQQEKLKHIFDRFSQIENVYTRKNSRGGTGLGLSIVKNLVALLDSDISVNSKLGKGSKFFFTANFNLPNTNQQIGTYEIESTVSGR